MCDFYPRRNDSVQAWVLLQFGPPTPQEKQHGSSWAGLLSHPSFSVSHFCQTDPAFTFALINGTLCPTNVPATKIHSGVSTSNCGSGSSPSAQDPVFPICVPAWHTPKKVPMLPSACHLREGKSDTRTHDVFRQFLCACPWWS